MVVTIFSSTGCIRCNIVKSFLKANDIDYTEYDIKTEEGDQEFKQLYRKKRKDIRRDSKGIFFPVVVFENDIIVQDAGSTLSRLITEGRLDEVIKPNQLGHGWTGGITISSGLGENGEDFLRILDIMKQGGLSIEAETNGSNEQILKRAVEERLIDRLIFLVPWEDESRQDSQGEELKKSLRIASAASSIMDVDYITGISPETTPEHIGETAKIMNESTHCNTLPYTIFCSSEDAPNLFPYRTAARRWQVRTDIKK